jgi:hypothetical protein
MTLSPEDLHPCPREARVRLMEMVASTKLLVCISRCFEWMMRIQWVTGIIHLIQ